MRHKTDAPAREQQRETVDPFAEAFEQIAMGLDSNAPQLCECDHGGEEAYEACGRKAKWRVTIDCTCGEDHPRTVEILCTRCLRTARKDLGRENITARPL
ncbi:hypothetical protein DC31_13645 [Microbacterium sp. CH12i]|uniref:hypothetical protein n=1 Tax=Microbacterium sp. CH12i TaxID=1479651 RepID=UPI00046175FB|nr:hypothetical protein [Microbacterium sp. CH12i]KDA05843.1 hypothetical protein DC31_13645 [Microbacterium sp. CH12i]